MYLLLSRSIFISNGFVPKGSIYHYQPLIYLKFCGVNSQVVFQKKYVYKLTFKYKFLFFIYPFKDNLPVLLILSCTYTNKCNKKSALKLLTMSLHERGIIPPYAQIFRSFYTQIHPHTNTHKQQA